MVLLFVVMRMLDGFSDPRFSIAWPGIVEGSFDVSTIIFPAAERPRAQEPQAA